MKPELIMMSPEEAKALLANNTENRKVRPGYVSYLCDQITSGLWMTTTDCIGIRDDGVVVNGQHRLMAIARSGRAVPVLFVKGISKSAYIVTDRGVGRSVADVSGIDLALVSDANLIARILDMRAGARVSEHDAIAIAAWWRPAHLALSGLHGRVEKRLRSVAVRVGFGARWAEAQLPADRKYIESQYRAFMTSETSAMSRATARLWQRVFQDGLSRGDRDTRQKAAAYVFHLLDPARADVAGRWSSHMDAPLKATLTLMPEARQRAMEQKSTHPYDFDASAPTPARKVGP
jgi:hypothetical protein